MSTKTDSPRTETSVSLQGHWLRAGRAIWIIAATISMITLVVFVPFAVQYLSTLDDSSLRTGLAQIGLSQFFYASFQTVITLITALTFYTLGVLLFWRKNDDRIALTTSITFITFGVGGAMYTNPATAALSPPINANPPLFALFVVTSIVGFSLAVTLPLLFPDGRFVPRWSWVIGVLGVILTISYRLPLDSPLQATNLPPLISIPLLFIVWGGGVFAQIYRYRKVSSPTQQQQTKWFVFGLAVIIILVLTFVMVEILILQNRSAGIVPLLFHLTISPLTTLAYIILPISVAFSIFRHRLWDIDFLINRSLVYGAVTGVLALVFGGILYVVSLFTQQNALGVILAAAAAFALFQPARRVIQRFIDQRLYRIMIDYSAKQPLPPPQTSMTTVLKDTGFRTYKDLQLVGKGGMAEVYKATHPTLNDPIALKILPAALVDHGDFRKRFLREAEIVSKLEHPNIVRVFDYGEDGGTHYIVMEFIAGEDLGEHLKAQPHLSMEQALPILREVASALDYAHAQQLVHRDIKPSNVMLDGAGNGENNAAPHRAVLTDFGIAKLLDSKTIMTQSGVLGTLDYMSPEQIQEAKDIDGRADVYALGIMAYQMFTGEMPFKQQNAGALLIAHLTQPAPDPREIVPDLPREAAHAIRKALAKQPSERYTTAGEFVANLAKV